MCLCLRPCVCVCVCVRPCVRVQQLTPAFRLGLRLSRGSSHKNLSSGDSSLDHSDWILLDLNSSSRGMMVGGRSLSRLCQKVKQIQLKQRRRERRRESFGAPTWSETLSLERRRRRDSRVTSLASLRTFSMWSSSFFSSSSRICLRYLSLSKRHRENWCCASSLARNACYTH